MKKLRRVRKMSGFADATIKRLLSVRISRLFTDGRQIFGGEYLLLRILSVHLFRYCRTILVRHPWSNGIMSIKILIMGNNSVIRLNVKTVQAFDAEKQMLHTAYTVSCLLEGVFSLASAWTLRDAVRLFRHLYGIDDNSVIHLIRPFKPQSFRK